MFSANLTSDRFDMESVAKNSGVCIDNFTVNQLQSLELERVLQWQLTPAIANSSEAILLFSVWPIFTWN